jgi:GT2 family glycosyltransferase
MRASMVIASLNEGDRLWRTVQSCLQTTDGLDGEVVVADDHSGDGSVEGLRRRFPHVRVVGHAERRGVAATKDLAARSAAGDVLVFLDGHCKPEQGAIARLVADVEELDGQAVVTPRIPALDAERWQNSPSQVGHGYRMDLERFDCGFIGLERLRAYRGTAGPRFYESPAFIGCCAALSRALYDKLWGFDPGMRSWGLEDLDFGLKAWLMGHPVLHDPEPVIGHRFRAAFDDYPVPMEHIVVNQLRTARKHFTDPVWDDWVTRCRARQPGWLWELAWKLFEEGRDGLERERAYLMAHRLHDEFWYAARFSLPWPVSAASGRSSPRGPLAHARTVPGAEKPRDERPSADLADDPRELFLEHYRSPRNRLILLNPDTVGFVQSASGAVLALYLRLGRDASGTVRIERATFQSERCGIAVAYASLLTERVRGQTVPEARGTGPSDLMACFGPGAGATEAAALTIAALQRALERVPEPAPAAT